MMTSVCPIIVDWLKRLRLKSLLTIRTSIRYLKGLSSLQHLQKEEDVKNVSSSDTIKQKETCDQCYYSPDFLSYQSLTWQQQYFTSYATE